MKRLGRTQPRWRLNGRGQPGLEGEEGSSVKRIGIILGGLFVVGVIIALLLSAPHNLPKAEIAANYTANVENGKALFDASNCAGCHATPGQDDRTSLGGGLKLPSSFGTFVVPNISPDKTHGIGGWTDYQFANAVKRGVGVKGEHLYPAFPYVSYSLLTTKDARDVFAYIKTLPAVDKVDAPHEMKFPFGIRRVLGFWKLLYFKPHEFKPEAGKSEAWNRGAYLTEGAAHCAECHSPRNALGGPVKGKEYAGAPNLEKGGRFAPNISSHPKDGVGDWSQEEMVDFLKTGTDRCFNDPEGMAGVIKSTSLWSDSDLAALAEYLHGVPAVAGNGEHKGC